MSSSEKNTFYFRVMLAKSDHHFYITINAQFRLLSVINLQSNLINLYFNSLWVRINDYRQYYHLFRSTLHTPPIHHNNNTIKTTIRHRSNNIIMLLTIGIDKLSISVRYKRYSRSQLVTNVWYVSYRRLEYNYNLILFIHV